MSRLKADVIVAKTLSVVQRKMMFKLFICYYGGCDEAMFYQDLENKHWVILLTNNNNIIRGFTTIYLDEHKIGQRVIRSVFSGDTIIHHQFWGEQTMTQAWCKFAGELKAQQPDTPLYWFLIVKGQRTYRYLRVFFKTFYPVYSEPTPVIMQSIMDYFGHARFGESYHKESGLIQFNTSHGHLKEQWTGIDTKTLKSKDVNFFLQCNPNHQAGDELVCLTELTESNLQRDALTAFSLGFNELDYA